MGFGPGGDGIEQYAQAIFGIDAAVVRAMSAQFTEERRIIGGDALADYRDAETRRGGRLRRNGRAENNRQPPARRAQGGEPGPGPRTAGSLAPQIRPAPDTNGNLSCTGKQ